MPVILTQNPNRKLVTQAKKAYSYDYPDRLDLRPGSDLHEKLVSEIILRANESYSHMSKRHARWRETDQFVSAYKPADEEEIEIKALDSRKPISIVVPYSYAILETLLSYMVAAFFQDPMFRYEGYGPEDVVGAILLEKVVGLHTNKFKVPLNLHTMFRDGFKHGIGPVAPTWKVYSKGRIEGNALDNIDPYLYLPDPNVAADKIQDGEYVGWIRHTNYMALLHEEFESDDVFNVRYLKELLNRRTAIAPFDASNRSIDGTSSAMVQNTTTGVDEIPMYIKIIPKEWGLSSSERPEIWFFRLAADSVIITARPADFDHGKFPVSCCVPDFDGYSSTPVSRLEIISGLQTHLDFLFNSHMTNVRKAINDMLIYDPSLINAADIRNPGPGKLIRLRPAAYGRGMDNAIKQLQVNDITRANLSDSGSVVQWMQKISAVDDAVMGSLRQGGPERLTGKEFQGTQAGAISRLERIAKVVGVQVMQDIGEFFAAHTQQIMSDDIFVKITGDSLPVLLPEYAHLMDRGRIPVSPKDLDIFYDVIVRDGSVPGGNYSDVWLRMFETIVQVPELAQSFDIVKIFKHIVRNAGAKDVNDFIRINQSMQTQMLPDEQVARQVEAGNLIPFQGVA